jgi:hypothetical protein
MCYRKVSAAGVTCIASLVAAGFYLQKAAGRRKLVVMSNSHRRDEAELHGLLAPFPAEDRHSRDCGLAAPKMMAPRVESPAVGDWRTAIWQAKIEALMTFAHGAALLMLGLVFGALLFMAACLFPPLQHALPLLVKLL